MNTFYCSQLLFVGVHGEEGTRYVCGFRAYKVILTPSVYLVEQSKGGKGYLMAYKVIFHIFINIL